MTLTKRVLVRVTRKAATIVAMVVDSTVAILVEGVVRIAAASIVAIVVANKVVVVVGVEVRGKSAMVLDCVAALKVPDIITSMTIGGMGGSERAT
jgi:hypothetical protein